MASERDFDLLDDYIGNRLNKTEKELFESKLQGDPELQREFKVQQGIINSLKKARTAELKAMLNNIPPASIPSATSSFAKWASLAVAVIVGIGLYFYLQPEKSTQSPAVADTTSVTSPAVSSADEQTDKTTGSDEPIVTQPEKTDKKSSENTTGKPPVSSAPAETSGKPTTPSMDVFDPSTETTTESSAPAVVIEKDGAEIPADDLTAEIVTNNKDYTFHYQFKDDKLILYGPFDKNLYEILEFISDNKRTIFLYYKSSYYLLNQAGEKVKSLSPVNDPVLIQKLKDHRSQ
jgi:hypothetical protein